uniref:Uncharacterized protein n=1 Tax=Molossus molossus TaxID=27622 RepID=A0A7J8EEW3_MOLMO|nr:hypothetical protein HJG59_008917 [Molossus molossus]
MTGKLWFSRAGRLMDIFSSEIPRLAVQNYFNPATITINLVQFLKPCPVEDQRGNTGHISTQLLKSINTEAGRQSWSLDGYLHKLALVGGFPDQLQQDLFSKRWVRATKETDIVLFMEPERYF